MKTFRRSMRAATFALAATAAGCVDYTIDTTIRADGSGTRVERMEVTRNSDLDLTAETFQALTGARPSDGWSSRTRVDTDGDTTWIVERTATIDAWAGWVRPSGTALLKGAPPDRADERVGLVRLGDVVYRDSLAVTRAPGEGGGEVVTYREWFVWHDAAAAVVEALVEQARRDLRERYPALSDEDRGTILGYFRGRLWAAGEAGAFSDPDADALIDDAVARTAAHAARVMGEPAREPGLRALFSAVVDVGSPEAEATFEGLLPGLTLGFNTSMVVRVTLPGTIVDTNADEREGNTLEWRFSPFDDLARPIELRARAVVGG
ncbi:MAG: hypothetical protein RLN75_05785 [Longimicrobiales bacterium]